MVNLPLPPLPDGVDPQDFLTTLIEPFDNPKPLILMAIGLATTSIYAAVFTLNDPDIAQALIERAQAKVLVTLVLDHTQTTTPTERPVVEMLLTQARVLPHLEVVIATSPIHNRIVHTKCVVIDATWTIDGSLNLTDVALQEVNDVNVIPSWKRAALFTGRILALRDWALVHDPQYQDHIPAEATHSAVPLSVGATSHAGPLPDAVMAPSQATAPPAS